MHGEDGSNVIVDTGSEKGRITPAKMDIRVAGEEEPVEGYSCM